MRTVTPCLALVAMLGLARLVGAGETEPSRPALLAVPSFTGTMPDGTPVMAIIVIPSENVLNKNPEWLAWERRWPTTYRLSPGSTSEESAP